MATQQAMNFISADTVAVVLKILQRAQKPLTVKDIARQLPGPYKLDDTQLAKVLTEQVCQGTIYQWLPLRAQKRFWLHNPAEYARQQALAILSKQPLSRPKLRDALKKSLFGCSESKARELGSKILKALLKERHVFEHPPAGRQRSSRFSANPPDPALYLGKVKKEFEAVCKKLARSGISPEHIFQAASSILAPSLSHPSGNAGFQPTLSVDKDVGVPSLQSTALPLSETPRVQDLPNQIVAKIVEVEPAARQQALVSVPALRTALNVPKKEFDQAILALAGEGKIFLHRHVDPAQMTDEKRRQMVADGEGNYYMGIVLR